MIFIPKHPSIRMSLQDYLINIVGAYYFNYNDKNMNLYSLILTTDKSCPFTFHHIFVRNSF